MSRRKRQPATPTLGAAGGAPDIAGEQNEDDATGDGEEDGDGDDAPLHVKDHDDMGHEQLHRR